MSAFFLKFRNYTQSFDSKINELMLNFTKIGTNYVLKSRIVAIALIGIILSSSVSVADGYTITLNVKEINEKIQKNEKTVLQLVKVNIFDGVDTSLFNFYDNVIPQIPYKINLLDGLRTKNLAYDNNGILKNNANDRLQSKTLSINLVDGVGAITNDYDHNNDIRIIKIKQDHDKKAIWESIFPLERIRNNIRSLYKEIQNDHILSYVQLSEVYSDDERIEQFSVLGFEFEQIDKFIGKANYVGDQFGIQWQHLTDVDKFIGKANYVGDQFGIQWQHLTDVDKFIGKANYVSIHLAGHVQQLTDPEKFVKKSNFVGKQLTISVYRVVDPNQPTLLVLLIPLASFVLIRSENKNIQFYHIQRFISIVFIVILVSSTVVSPFYLSMLYWGYAYAQEPEDIGPPAVPPSGEIQQQPIEEISVPPPVDELPIETSAESIAETPVQSAETLVQQS